MTPEKKKNSEQGVILLPMVISISLILFMFVILITLIGFGTLGTSSNLKDANDAFFIADAGVKDAMLRVSRNFNFSSGGYTLTVLDGTATVVVEKDQPSVGQTRITSTGTENGSQRKIQVITNVVNNGKITIASYEEIAP